jgi:tetratricopeptide (TPR) repeat protein
MDTKPNKSVWPDTLGHQLFLCTFVRPRRLSQVPEVQPMLSSAKWFDILQESVDDATKKFQEQGLIAPANLRAQLEQLHRRHLQALLKKHNLSTTGTKAELIDRALPKASEEFDETNTLYEITAKGWEIVNIYWDEVAKIRLGTEESRIQLDPLVLLRQGLDAAKEITLKDIVKGLGIAIGMTAGTMISGVIENRGEELYQRIKKEIEDAFEKSGSPQGYLEKGKQYLSEGKLDSAITAFERAYELMPNNNEILERLCQAYDQHATNHFRKEQYDQAIGDYTKIIKLGPDITSPSFNPQSKFGQSVLFAYGERGMCYFRKLDYKQAKEEFEKIIKFEPDDSPIREYLQSAEEWILDLTERGFEWIDGEWINTKHEYEWSDKEEVYDPSQRE